LSPVCFGGGVLWWATSYAPSNLEKDACYKAAAKSGRTTEECKSFWEKTTSDPVATFTLVLAISTIGLWGATIALYFAGERQLKIARQGAEAADLNARAAIALQLPLIRIEPNNLGRETLQEEGKATTEACSIPCGRNRQSRPYESLPERDHLRMDSRRYVAGEAQLSLGGQIPAQQYT
jgi:hypothetical protein